MANTQNTIRMQAIRGIFRGWSVSELVGCGLTTRLYEGFNQQFARLEIKLTYMRLKNFVSSVKNKEISQFKR